MTVELGRVHFLTIGQRVTFAGLVEASLQPGILVRFDDPGGGVFGVPVGVDVEPPVLVGSEDEGEGVEPAGGTEPDELGLAHVDGWFEAVLVGLPHDGGAAVGTDQQIAVAPELLGVIDLGLVMNIDAHVIAALLQDL